MSLKLTTLWHPHRFLEIPLQGHPLHIVFVCTTMLLHVQLIFGFDVPDRMQLGMLLISMTKLIYRKLSYDIFSFFLLSSFAITLIVWVVQGVNLLDLVSEQGHGLKVYFFYTLLSFPKIFARLMLFMFFLSVFYTIIKYEEKNELII